MRTEKITLFGYPAELKVPESVTVKVDREAIHGGCGCGPMWVDVPVSLGRSTLGEPVLKLDFEPVVDAIYDAKAKGRA